MKVTAVQLADRRPRLGDQGHLDKSKPSGLARSSLSDYLDRGYFAIVLKGLP
jgi:hypothetical protein